MTLSTRTDPLGLQKGWWIKGSKWYKTYVKGSRFLPGEGERSYIPPKAGRGNPHIVNSDPIDKQGNKWEYAKPSTAHGGAQWDVQHLNGSHTNVAVDGNVIGEDNFVGTASAGSKYDPNNLLYNPASVNKDGTPTDFGITGTIPITSESTGTGGSPIGDAIAGESELAGYEEGFDGIRPIGDGG